MAITIAGKKYQVIDSLGFVQSIGAYAKLVKTSEGEKMVVGNRGYWRFWTPKDRLSGGWAVQARGQ